MEDAVNDAVRLAGGVDFIEPGQTVLIKPNVTGAAVYPTTTNPRSSVCRDQADRRPGAEANYCGGPKFFASLRRADAQDD